MFSLSFVTISWLKNHWRGKDILIKLDNFDKELSKDFNSIKKLLHNPYNSKTNNHLTINYLLSFYVYSRKLYLQFILYKLL